MDHPVQEENAGKTLKDGRVTRILVAPLDWGLGHATRCIPLVRELLKAGSEVIIAADGPQAILLKEEFPGLRFLQLPGYSIRYPRQGRFMTWKMLLQSGKLFNSIRTENKWLQQAVAEHSIDAVISDNRYGLHHSSIPCIFITHQLTIKSPFGKWTEKVLQKRNYRYINKFTECWVPDTATNGLAGELSHPGKLPVIPLRYIGPLSRFPATGDQSQVKKDHLLFILSGPEPQRSILENKLIPQLSQYNGTVTVVRGLPGHSTFIPSTNMLHFYNHLPAQALVNEMAKAEFVISRSGYSTVMDLAALQKKSILIPTPGQTEQEYLSLHLAKQGFAPSVSQQQFDLKHQLATAKSFTYQFPQAGNNLSFIVQQFMASLQQ